MESTSPDLLGEIVEVGRAGARFSTPIPYEPGTAVHLELAYRGETVAVEGKVRWCRQSDVEPTEDALAVFDVGIAFTSIDGAADDGIWRGLEPYRESEDDTDDGSVD